MIDTPDFFDPDSDEIVDKQIIEHEPASTPTSIARRAALQVLYELDTVDHAVGDVLNYHIENQPETQPVQRYVRKLVISVRDYAPEMDHVLEAYAPEWPIDQLAVIDRNILRIALYEMGIGTRTPIKVAIDEAVELAKLFGAEGSTRFVNGVLGALAADLDAVRDRLSHHHQSAADLIDEESE